MRERGGGRGPRGPFCDAEGCVGLQVGGESGDEGGEDGGGGEVVDAVREDDVFVWWPCVGG